MEGGKRIIWQFEKWSTKQTSITSSEAITSITSSLPKVELILASLGDCQHTSGKCRYGEQYIVPVNSCMFFF